MVLEGIIMSTLAEVAAQLKRVREETGLTQGELAARAGVNHFTDWGRKCNPRVSFYVQVIDTPEYHLLL